MCFFGSKILFLNLYFCLFLFGGCAHNSSKDPAFVGKQIREARLRQHISQEMLAQWVGISKNTLILIEEGQATPIESKMVEIKKYLQMSND